MRHLISKWAKSERGNVAILFGLMLPLVVGGAAYGVETTYWYLTRLQLQNAADAAAMAGAMDKRSGYATSTIQASATKAATDNGFVNSSPNTITINAPPTSGAAGSQAVEVILTAKAKRFFTAVFSNADVNVRARAVARYQTAGNACVLALNTSASGAANFQGSTTLNLTSCSVMSNSLSSSAISVQGSATLNTECLIAVGGISNNGGAHTACDSAITGAAPVADPFASIPAPTAGSCSGGNGTTPGTYCNGLTLTGNKTLASGVYIINGGTLKINNNTTIDGTSGVTFYLMNGADIQINGSAQVNLTAPSTGPYAGMVFMGERTNTAVQKVNGNASSHITGNIYFKGGQVQYLGNFSGLNGCTQVVADQVYWSGNSSFAVDCSQYGMAPIPAAYTVRLFE